MLTPSTLLAVNRVLCDLWVLGVNEGLHCIKRTLNQWSFISRSSCYLYGLIIGVILVVHFT